MYKKIFLLLIGVLFNYHLFSQDFPEPQNPPRLVNDYAGLLNAQEQKLLEGKLRRYNDTTSSQFTVVIIPSTGDYDIGQYAAELGEEWGVGRSGKDNGLLLLVALEDRNVFIATGYGLEPTITDAGSKRVIENYIKPNFQQEQYFEGLDQATSILMGMASGEFTGDDLDGGEGGGVRALVMLFLFLLFMVGIPYLRYRKMKQHNHYGGKSDMGFLTAMLLMGSMGRGGSSFGDFSGGGGSFGGGGGGFGGFGGGSFGGGGAGGSW